MEEVVAELPVHTGKVVMEEMNISVTLTTKRLKVMVSSKALLGSSGVGGMVASQKELGPIDFLLKRVGRVLFRETQGKNSGMFDELFDPKEALRGGREGRRVSLARISQ